METKPQWVSWGLATMFLIGPLLSWFLGRIYGTMVSSGFAAAYVTIILLLVFFVIGIYMVFKGFKKSK
jgi:L-asparagine transporter-like permease